MPAPCINSSVIFGYKKWDPSLITTSLWLDASDTSYIVQSGGSVSQWNDKSGNGNHADQSTGSKQPTTNSRTLNGINVLDFDAALSQTLYIPSVPYGGATDLMLFAVAKNDSTASYEFIMLGTGSDKVGIGQQGASYRYIADNQSYITGTANDLSPHLLNICVDSGTNAEFFIDGTSIDARTGTYSIATQSAYIGSQNDLYFLNGYVAEIIVATICTLANRQKIEGYLAHKWGLTSSLPSTHPYKISPPTI